MEGSRSSTELSFARDLPVTQAAIEFARERHSGQRRNADGAPFVLHPFELEALDQLPPRPARHWT